MEITNEQQEADQDSRQYLTFDLAGEEYAIDILKVQEIRGFESTTRHQSFTLAAAELHLTQSAISRQVKELENTVGTALFRRVGRGVVLTAAAVAGGANRDSVMPAPKIRLRCRNPLRSVVFMITTETIR